MQRHPVLKRHKFLSFPRYRRPLQIRWLPALTVMLTICFVGLLVATVLGMLVFAYFSKGLPSPNRLVERERALSTKIFDRNGQLLYDVYGEQNRTLVKIEELPPSLIDATLAAEDAEFYTHKGVDLFGILRAFFNVVVHHRLQGGSTITQQLVRNTVITQERTITRKIREFILALQIERKYSKDEILQMYFNETPYGGQSYGVEAAAETYLKKSAKELTLAESALLAGLPQAPSRYSPYGSNPENAENRRRYVLHLMETKGWLDKEGKRHYLSTADAKAARETVITYAAPGGAIKAPHFVMYVKELLSERYGEDMVERGGLQVTTTLDLEQQEKLQAIVTEEIDKVRQYKIGNGALLAMNPQTGEILTMVGSTDFFNEERDGQVNVTLRPRQPGSAIKPITYATAFKQGYSPAAVLFDVPTTFPGGAGQPDYKPEDYDGKWRGPISLRFALANSINMVAVKLLKLVGIPAMLQTAHDLGITTLNEPSRYGLALTLGGGEVLLIDLVTAYSGFATGGKRVTPQALLEVKDSAGHVLEKFQPTEGPQVLSEDVAFLVSSVLSDNESRSAVFGPASALKVPGYTVAAKTGTTNNMRDNWTVGYTRSLAVGVWVGNNDNSEMGSLVSGITGAAPIWNRAMRELLAGRPDEPFYPPEGIVRIPVCSLSGELVPGWCREDRFKSDCLSREEYFVKGTTPTDECSALRLIEVCKSDGKITSRACKQAGETETRVYFNFQEKLSEWQEFVDAWVNATYGSDSKYHPPTEVSQDYFNPEGKDEPWIKIIDPEQDNPPLEFNIRIEVVTPYTVNKVEFYIDDDKIEEVTSIPYETHVKFSKGEIGAHEIKVRAFDSGGNVGESTKDITVIAK